MDLMLYFFLVKQLLLTFFVFDVVANVIVFVDVIVVVDIIVFVDVIAVLNTIIVVHVIVVVVDVIVVVVLDNNANVILDLINLEKLEALLPCLYRVFG